MDQFISTVLDVSLEETMESRKDGVELLQRLEEVIGNTSGKLESS